MFARDVSTGYARWSYQSTPHDLFDHDDINESLLVDWPAPNGQRIPALIRPSRNGYFYVHDRRTGRVLLAPRMQKGRFVLNRPIRGEAILSRSRRRADDSRHWGVAQLGAAHCAGAAQVGTAHEGAAQPGSHGTWQQTSRGTQRVLRAITVRVTQCVRHS